MAAEWNDPFNPFNSMKVLMWKEHLEACSKGEFLPPVTVDVDPSNRCNFKCKWCNACDAINSPEAGDIPPDHLIRLADFFKKWRDDTGIGPWSACVAGGGEPLMNPGTLPFLERMVENGMENGLITNGSLMTEDKIETIARNCRWVGISVDASSSKTFIKVKGISNEKIFYNVIKNISALTNTISKLGIKKNDVCFKYLLHPDNAEEILQAVRLAKSIGCKDFHLRPVGWINITKTKNEKPLEWEGLINSIDEQMEEALKLEDENFHVYGIRHKFNSDFSVKKNFSKCWTIPMLPTFGADGWVHTCFDMRGREDLKMCKHFPDPNELLKFWNTEEHKKLVDSIDINKCTRCTFGLYNEAIEKVILKDKMCYKFP